MSGKEDVYSLLEAFEGRFLKCLMTEELVGAEPWTSLLEEFMGIKEIFQTIATEETFNFKALNIIDRLKLAQNVISLKNSDYDDKEISEILSTQTGQHILQADVSIWLENYSNITLSARPQVLRGSIFDTQSRMQDLHERLLILMEEVKKMTAEDFKYTKTTKPEVIKDIISEMRQLTKDASQVITAISNLNRLKEFQQMVLEAIATVSPQVQQAILRKLGEQKAIMGALLPPS